jgi:hypothetical protein
MPIDAGTYTRYHNAVTKAKAHGMSLPEVLDRDRLLLTVARERAIQEDALKSLARRLSKQSPGKLLRFYYGRETGTAAEAFSAVEQWIEAVIRAVAKGTLEEVDDQANMMPDS